eukprot:CAMPEP_0172609386 /NCGR_PEP_ID=MMETSP1068-20121228/29399_1 /TAXON_ID=35684 /ORGANISM="Pseudopedinella elastica, Strain CCMP716" /LENGTH=51 /DNA_ID=CAMNT_0013412891 /DNA_START=235 /DNA_END=390 /DNA_ORIENTATION=+
MCRKLRTTVPYFTSLTDEENELQELSLGYGSTALGHSPQPVLTKHAENVVP